MIESRQQYERVQKYLLTLSKEDEFGDNELEKIIKESCEMSCISDDDAIEMVGNLGMLRINLERDVEVYEREQINKMKYE